MRIFPTTFFMPQTEGEGFRQVRMALRILENADAGDIVETEKAIKILRKVTGEINAGDSAGDGDRAS